MLTYCWNTEVAGARQEERAGSEPATCGARGWEQLAHHSLIGHSWTGGRITRRPSGVASGVSEKDGGK